MKREDYLTPKEVSERIPLSVIALRKRREMGLPPPYIKVGRRIFYADKDIQSFLHQGRVEPNNTQAEEGEEIG